MKLTEIQWFSFEEKKPEDSTCIFVHWSDYPEHARIETDYEWADGKLYDMDYKEIEITDGMLWAYWPDLQTKRHSK